MWCELSVVLSAASCLSWVSHAVGGEIPALLRDIEADPTFSTGSLIFLPYLSGERTPHNDPNAMGVFFGLTFEHKRHHLVQAVLEGVAFAFADGVRVLQQGGVDIGDITVIGGAHGAARLARLAYTGERAADVCTKPPIDITVPPDATLVDGYRAKAEVYRQLYRDLKSTFGQAVNL